MTNLERMTSFLNDVQGTFMQYGWPYVLPQVSSSLNENDESDDRLIDAHWKTEKFELLLSCDEDGFSYYGDDYGKRTFRKGDASPQDVAETIRLLQNEG